MKQTIKNLDNLGLSLINSKSVDGIELNDIDFIELIDSGILDAIPYLGPVITTLRGTMNLRDKIFTKKFVRFLQDYNNQNIDIDKLDSFQERIQTDKQYRIKVTETLIEYIDTFKSSRKIEIYSNLFSSYISGVFSWEYFLQLSESLERVDVQYLEEIPKIDTFEGKEVTEYDEEETMAESNLESSGLAIRMSTWSSDIYPTKIGKDIYKYGLKKI